MPKREVLSFDGDPVSYPVFSKNFEVNVEQKVTDYNTRLAYLIQHCTGPAKEAIKNCIILPLDQGYKEAKRILHQNFWQKHLIVRATIDKVLKGPQLKGFETDKLLQLACNMKSCNLSPFQINYRADINAMGTLGKKSSSAYQHISKLIGQRKCPSSLQTPGDAPNSSNGASGTSYCGTVQTSRPHISLQVVPVRVSKPKGGPKIETYAFLDSGSYTKICLDSLVDRLELNGKSVNYTLSTLNDEKRKRGYKCSLM
ncbi:uncharacterized protein [Ptychodera flava]|uniref:uncharacterized protein n=1 Tax=Ptychodera flava TaxID=63121 RepID=UPI00396A8FC6